MQSKRKFAGVVAAVIAAAVFPGTAAQAAVPLTEVISDPFTNTSSQHATAVEPDTFADATTNTIVSAAQVGRFFDGGASGIGVAASNDGGTTWSPSVLPGITTHNGNGGIFDRVSDPVVAYSAKHDAWLVSSIPLASDLSVPDVFVSRSTDGGHSWSGPIPVIGGRLAGDFDKNWTVCDNHPTSPFYGNCYTTFDDFADGDRLYVSTSHDGGLTWDLPKQTANRATGLGGQPVVQPNGTVVIPASDAFEFSILAFRSTDGGQTWGRAKRVSRSLSHNVAGDLRTGPLPSAEIDGSGRVHVVWQDCRFRPGCTGNDIVMSTSTDGVSWTRPVRVPIGTVNDGNDNFIPGIAVDPAAASATVKLGLTFYFYDNAACGSACSLRVGYIQSNDGGTNWSAVTELAGPFPVAWTPDTSQGRMVGDYISTSWLGGKAFGAFAVANAAPGPPFDQTIDVPTGGVVTSGAFTQRAGGERVDPSNQGALNSDEHSAVRRRPR